MIFSWCNDSSNAFLYKLVYLFQIFKKKEFIKIKHGKIERNFIICSSQFIQYKNKYENKIKFKYVSVFSYYIWAKKITMHSTNL